jgi:hypothetical protein
LRDLNLAIADRRIVDSVEQARTIGHEVDLGISL